MDSLIFSVYVAVICFVLAALVITVVRLMWSYRKECKSRAPLKLARVSKNKAGTALHEVPRLTSEIAALMTLHAGGAIETENNWWWNTK